MKSEPWQKAYAILDWRAIQNRKRNVIYFGLNETKEHFMLKANTCYDLLKEGKEFICEAIFKNNSGRADIFVISQDGVYAIEIVHTEDISKSGKEKYPCPVVFKYTKEGNQTP